MSNFPENMENSIEVFYSIKLINKKANRKFDCCANTLMNSIGFFIENLSYNWSIITYRDSNTNSVGVFDSIKLINKKANRKFDCCANTVLTINF